jgi:hypothetical protein
VRIKQHYPRINEPIRVKGVNFWDLLYLTLGLVFSVILIGIVSLIINLSIVTTLVCLILLFFGYYRAIMFLIKMNKHDDPQFLLSWISFKIFQPKQIVFYNPLKKWKRPLLKK